MGVVRGVANSVRGCTDAALEYKLVGGLPPQHDKICGGVRSRPQKRFYYDRSLFTQGFGVRSGNRVLEKIIL